MPLRKELSKLGKKLGLSDKKPEPVTHNAQTTAIVQSDDINQQLEEFEELKNEQAKSQIALQNNPNSNSDEYLFHKKIIDLIQKIARDQALKDYLRIHCGDIGKIKKVTILSLAEENLIKLEELYSKDVTADTLITELKQTLATILESHAHDRPGNKGESPEIIEREEFDYQTQFNNEQNEQEDKHLAENNQQEINDPFLSQAIENIDRACANHINQANNNYHNIYDENEYNFNPGNSFQAEWQPIDNNLAGFEDFENEQMAQNNYNIPNNNEQVKRSRGIPEREIRNPEPGPGSALSTTVVNMSLTSLENAMGLFELYDKKAKTDIARFVLGCDYSNKVNQQDLLKIQALKTALLKKVPLEDLYPNLNLPNSSAQPVMSSNLNESNDRTLQ